MDRILIFLLFCCLSTLSFGQTPIEIRVNLQGYHPNMPKIALILSKEAIKNPILLLKNEAGKTVEKYRATQSSEAWEPFSHYYQINFSNFETEGTYYLALKGKDLQSTPFSISPYPAWQEDVVRFIQTQRCGFNPYTREFCHQKDGLSFFGIRPDSTRNRCHRRLARCR